MHPIITAALITAVRYLPPLAGMFGVASSDSVAIKGAEAITNASSYADDMQLLVSACVTLVTLGLQFWRKLQAERNKAPVESRDITNKQ